MENPQETSIQASFAKMSNEALIDYAKTNGLLISEAAFSALFKEFAFRNLYIAEISIIARQEIIQGLI